MTPGFSFVGTAGYATEVGPRGGTGFLIKQDVMGCVTQLRWKGQKFDQATWVRLKKVEAELACACQRVYALFRRRVAKLNLLTT
jgi:hypothetical protein